jgi:hypothetical protein
MHAIVKKNEAETKFVILTIRYGTYGAKVTIVLTPVKKMLAALKRTIVEQLVAKPLIILSSQLFVILLLHQRVCLTVTV